MIIENQVANLDLCKRLKEIEIKKESYFGYFYLPHEDKYEIGVQFKSRIGIPAYTVTELGEMLPAHLILENGLKVNNYLLATKNKDNRWLVSYIVSESLPPIVSFIGKTEADARAEMLIYLIKNVFIKAEDLK